MVLYFVVYTHAALLIIITLTSVVVLSQALHTYYTCSSGSGSTLSEKEVKSYAV